MKVCSQCGFENPDQALDCLKCGRQLSLTRDQQAELQNQFSHLVNPLNARNEEKLRNSWMEAMSHRFDWLWKIGDAFEVFQFKFTSFIILFLILLVFLLLSYMLNSLFSSPRS